VREDPVVSHASSSGLPEGVTIELESAEAVESLRDLWLEVHSHHEASAPDLAEYVSDEESWAIRSESYREWLDQPDSFVFVARRAGQPIGYALVRVDSTEPFWKDTWRVGERLAELETLAVTAKERGTGIGSALLDRVEDELDERGIDDVLIGMVAGNDDAQRLYERRGYQPTWLFLSRFASRER
jgi:GNAT superfamily N-acetyltransferase